MLEEEAEHVEEHVDEEEDDGQTEDGDDGEGN